MHKKKGDEKSSVPLKVFVTKPDAIQKPTVDVPEGEGVQGEGCRIVERDAVGFHSIQEIYLGS